MQTKITMRYYYEPIGMAKIQNIDHTKYWRQYAEAGILMYFRWGYKVMKQLWKKVWQIF